MKKLALALLFVVALAGCAKLNSAYDAVTNGSVPRQTVAVAISGFNVAKATATNYIRYCTPVVQPKGCDDTLIRTKLIPTMRSGTVARNSLSEFMKNNPGVLGPRGTYNALVSATDTINSMKLEYAK